MSAEVKPQAKPQSADRIGEVVIEICNDRNRNVLWPINKRELRGRWDRTNMLGQTAHQSMTKLPDVPGMHVVLDCGKRVSRIHDPLNDPRNRELAVKILAILEGAFRVKYTAEKDSEQTRLTDTDVKTHLYWMRRHVDDGMAKLVRGNLPSLDEIADLPGQTMIQHFNSSSRAVRTLERQRALDEALDNELIGG